VKVGSTVYKYSVDASGNLTSNTPYYFTTTNNVSLSSWYPYTSTALSSFSVQSDQTTYANREKSDLLYGAATVNQGSANVISYSHKVAKLIVSVKVNNTQHIANGTISKLTMSGIKLSGTVSDGTLTASGSNGTITLHNTIASSTSNNNSTATFEAYLIPQTTTSTFVVSVGGTNLSIAVPSKTFAAGKIHTLELIYNVAGSGTENGHAWVRMGTSVKWATMNVGATSTTGTASLGNIYQWGATTEYANVSQFWNVTHDITPTSGHDIARIKWGGIWRMPTNAEFQILVNTNNYTWTWVTENSISGYRITCKRNNNILFLPAAGSKEFNAFGQSSNSTDKCCYWSSTYFKPNHAYSLGWGVNPQTIPYLDSDGNGYSRFSEAYSIRPVCD
jgi:hypothetical protein